MLCYGNMRYFFALVIFSVLLSFPTKLSAAADREYIIVSGAPALYEWEKFKAELHDRWWGNFIRPARVRMAALREKFGPDALITWLVYRPGYDRRTKRMNEADVISNILSVRDKYHVNLIWFKTGDELIDYLNAGLPRNQIKIANFEFYGHSNKACFMFDYSNEIDSASKAWLHENDLKKIHRGLFTRDAFIKSWGCYTGESMSQKWRQATGKRMIGAVGKTDYSKMYLNNWVPGLSEGSRWGG